LNDLYQGCQIFLETVYQNEGKDTKLPPKYQMVKNLPNGCMYIIYVGIPNGQRIYNPFPFKWPSNVDPNWDFWFESKPSGNPDLYVCMYVCI
jgi:hypothetical protein